MKQTVEVEVFALRDGERVVIIPSGFEGAKLVVFEDYTYDISVHYLTPEMYEKIKNGATA